MTRFSFNFVITFAMDSSFIGLKTKLDVVYPVVNNQD